MRALKRGILGFVVLCSLPLALAQAQEEPKPAAEPKKPAIPIKKLGQVSGFADWVTSAAWSPDGKLVAAGSYNAVKLVDPKTREVTATWKIKGFARSLAFSPDSKRLAIGRFRGAEVWDVTAAKATLTLEGQTGYVLCVAYSPDGETIVSSAEDGTVRFWNAEDGKPGAELEESEYPVTGVAFSPDGTLLALSLGDETRVTQPGPVQVWDVATLKKKLDLPEHEKVANSVAFSTDGRFLISSSTDEKVNVYDIAAGKALGFFAGHNRPTNAAVFLGGTETILSGGGGRAKGGNLVIAWNRQDGEEIAKVEAHEGRVTSLALSPDQKTVASGSYDKTLAFLDLSAVLAARQSPQVAANAEKTAEPRDPNRPLRAGIIGLDTSHAVAFTKLLNADDAPEDLANCRIVAAYPKGSPDIQSSVVRVPEYTEAVKKQGVEIVDSIEELIKKVDVVFLETNDGRPHLEQVLPVLKAGKPVFIDKPIAGSLSDAVAIFEASRKFKTPIFSSSSLRYMEGAQAARNGELGKIQSAEAYSPCILEPTHPDLYWYGIHGVEALFTVMGTGCQSAKRTVDDREKIVVVGQWTGDRVGTFTGHKQPKGYGGKATGDKGSSDLGKYGGYRPLLVDIVKFFRTGNPPVSEAETLEIYAFMEAADESKRQGGIEIPLETVLTQARANGTATLNRLLEQSTP